MRKKTKEKNNCSRYHEKAIWTIGLENDKMEMAPHPRLVLCIFLLLSPSNVVSQNTSAVSCSISSIVMLIKNPFDCLFIYSVGLV